MPIASFGLSLAATAVLGTALFAETCDPFFQFILLPAIRLLDAEQAHRLGINAGKWKLIPRQVTGEDPVLYTTAFHNKHLENPIGLAAGFDKDAEIPEEMLGLGFGFVEVGTVTPKPQAGNPKPRMFRLMEDGAVINRLGFNNGGIEAMKERFLAMMKRRDGRWDQESGGYGPIGINVGKNKTTEDAASDYEKCVLALAEYADYLVINVSSPNTPGLRVLQGKKELSNIVNRVHAARHEALKDKIGTNGMAEQDPKSKFAYPPIFVKIAPDMGSDDMKDIAAVCKEGKIDGLIVSNTTISRPDTLQSGNKGETGGLSGKPLMDLATVKLREMFILTEGKITLIGVGGVASGVDAYRKIRNGASLVQIYSSMTLQGPGIVYRIKKELAELLRRDGFEHVGQAVGVDVKLP
eukprot:Clim_evm9s219 gene=Clim_evmTU9s219